MSKQLTELEEAELDGYRKGVRYGLDKAQTVVICMGGSATKTKAKEHLKRIVENAVKDIGGKEHLRGDLEPVWVKAEREERQAAENIARRRAYLTSQIKDYAGYLNEVDGNLAGKIKELIARETTD